MSWKQASKPSSKKGQWHDKLKMSSTSRNRHKRTSMSRERTGILRQRTLAEALWTTVMQRRTSLLCWMVFPLGGLYRSKCVPLDSCCAESYTCTDGDLIWQDALEHVPVSGPKKRLRRGGISETYKPGTPANTATLLIQCPWHRLAVKKQTNFQETKNSQERKNPIPICQWQQKAMSAKLDQSGSWYKPYTMRQRTKTEGKFFLRNEQQISMHLNTTLQ